MSLHDLPTLWLAFLAINVVHVVLDVMFGVPLKPLTPLHRRYPPA